MIFHFHAFGPLVSEHNAVDPKRSPLVSIAMPRRERGVLTTVGEVHFLPTNLPRAFPGLASIHRRFQAWLAGLDLIYDGQSGDWDYYLEGSVRNHDTRIYALPGAMSELGTGAYFVGDDDNDDRIDIVCRMLALRGVQCSDPSGDISGH